MYTCFTSAVQYIETTSFIMVNIDIIMINLIFKFQILTALYLLLSETSAQYAKIMALLLLINQFSNPHKNYVASVDQTRVFTLFVCVDH